MKRISFIALNECMASSISLPFEMLNAAATITRSQSRQSPIFQPSVVAIDKTEVKTMGGLTLVADTKLDDVADTDVIILPALWRNPLTALKRFNALIPWLKTMAGKDTIICAVGTSTYFLASAGLLDNKPATTHWYYADDFQQRYPKVQLKQQYLITQADNLYCAGSVNSVADLIVHLIGQFYGQQIAQQVESQFSPEIRRPFEQHAYAQFDTRIHQDEVIMDIQEWLRQHNPSQINFKQLANDFGLTLRSFNRRFKNATNTTPSAYLQRQRLDNAKELLRTTDLEVSSIAERCGYSDNSYFSSKFKSHVGQTPLSYRKSVRGKLFQLD